MSDTAWPHLSAANADRLLTTKGAPFEMRETEVNGNKVRAYVDAPSTMADLFGLSATWGGREALILNDERISFEGLRRAALAIAAELGSRFGLQKGDRVAVAMRNLPEWVACFWAIVASGRVIVPLNAWWQTDELRYALEDCGAKLVICDQQRETLLGEVISDLGLASLIARGDKSSIRSLTDIVGPAGGWDSLPDRSMPDIDIAPDDMATLFYTSGTTGKPKGAIGSHRNLATNLVNLRVRVARSALRRGEAYPPAAAPPQKTTLLPTPLFHVTGTHSGIVPAMAAGTRMVFMHKWELDEALRLVEQERVNTLVTVPTMSWQIVKCPTLGSYDLSSLETISFGGGPAGAGLVEQLRTHFPRLAFGNGYGLTETSSVVASNGGEDLLRKPDSVGRIMPCNDARLVDDEGRDVPCGERGELLVRGPNVIAGYWGRPRESDPAFDGEWLRTGDVGRFDEEEFLYILDRKKDVIIRGGENVYCAEIEEILQDHPAVAEAAVIGMPHDILGEEVAAVVVLQPDSGADAADLRAYLSGRLAAFKIPARIAIRSEPLARNAGGKVLKAVLRDALGFRTT